MKKLLSLLICVMLLFTMTVPAYAEDTDPSQETQHSCSWGEGTVTKNATCGAPGEKLYTCAGCGSTKTETIPASGPHTYETAKKLDEKTHEAVCTACSTLVTEDHTWENGTVTKEATCKEEGVRTYTCKFCEDDHTEAIAKVSHTYGEWTGTKGEHTRKCSGCGGEEKASHTMTETVTKEASCKEEGTKTLTCSVCAYSENGIIPKTAHTYGEWTKDKSGHSHKCSICGYEEKASHTMTEKVTKEATCKEEGAKTLTCSACGYSETAVIAKSKMHTYGNWKASDSGHVRKCGVCEVEDKSDHVYDNACDEECNDCKAKRTTSHSYTKVWSCDFSGHWYECTKCGMKDKYARHIAGPGATEEKAQTCTVCSYVITPKKEHKHSYDNKWTGDEVGHWHECTGENCKNEKDYASHEYDDDCDEECNVCRYQREADHNYGDWQTDEVEHWKICSDCEKEMEHEGHVPGEEATDEAAQVCTVCDYELAPVLEHFHDFGNDWIQAEESHWQDCKCGELSVPEPHIWDAGIENRKEDTITYSCTVCGAEKTEEAPSSGFPWIVVFIVLALVCVGGIVAIVIILKRGEYDDDDEDEFDD